MEGATGATSTALHQTEPTAAEATDPAPTAPADRVSRFAHQPGLDGVRAVGLLAVVAFHLDYRWARGGFLGVDLFFVLSGFLITTLLLREWARSNAIGLRAFWGRRARRLLPAALLTIAGVAVFTRVVVDSWNRPAIRADGLASLFYVANWRFISAQQGYFNTFSAPSPLRHMWSLAVEEQFYLLWPLLVLGLLSLGRGSLLPLLVVCVAGIAASALAMAHQFDRGHTLRAYYGTDTRAQTVVVGALLAVVLHRWPPGASVRRLLAWAGGAAALTVVVCMATVTGDSWRFAHGGTLAFAVLGALMIAGAMQAGPVRAVLATPVLRWVGRLSYGLYLFHWPVIVWLVPSRLDLSTNRLNLVRVAVTVGLALVSYHLVEMPIRRRTFLSVKRFTAGRTVARHDRPGRRQPRDASPWLAVPAIAAVTAVVVASASGATAAPSYLVSERPADLPGVIWGLGDPFSCGDPSPSEAKDGADAAAQLDLRGLRHTADGVRILLAGDSTACSLAPGMQAVGKVAGADVEVGAVSGCGFVASDIASVRGEPVGPNTSRCPTLVLQAQETAIAQLDPDIVVWTSTWEKSDLVIDGRTLESGTPAGDKAMLGLMDDAYERVTAGGAKVVLLTSAAPAPNAAALTTGEAQRVTDEGYVRLRSIQRRFLARHRGQVRVIDLAARVCPGGAPCPAKVEGMEQRPDGRHFTPEASAHQAQWLLPRILSVLG